MKRRIHSFVPVTLVAVALWASGSLFFPSRAAAQQGENAVYNGTSPVPSPSFIDSSMFAGSATDICGVLQFVLAGSSYPASGAVIDARGFNPNNTKMTCEASPWAGITNPKPSTILLPAGTIQISTPWVLPSNTRLIGEGESDPVNAVPGTTIQAVAGSEMNPNTMITFGSSAVCGSSGCSGISAGGPAYRVLCEGRGVQPSQPKCKSLP
jgi:hypothetical protein